ncbi:hypothetical protein CMI42_02685 [Candidatus Pacearchaeota archaeon]|nr:hypothetical protein [Candidatus Pacearchaeota archaeon]|tara:strand:- start:14 stop:466 length:453 start_codon:yes stop_codon:yes gene_type:complete
MNIKKVKQGSQITFYNGIYMIILGVYFIFFVNFNMRSNFGAVSQLWGFFSKFNSEIAYLFFLFNVIVGVFLVSNGVNIMYLSDFIYKRKEKLPWVILFVSGIISWAGLLTIMILARNWVLIILTFIGWAMFIVGMLLPIRYYLEKNYREY